MAGTDHKELMFKCLRVFFLKHQEDLFVLTDKLLCIYNSNFDFFMVISQTISILLRGCEKLVEEMGNRISNQVWILETAIP